jgi:hypothetical protein
MGEVRRKTLLGTPLKKVYGLPSGEYNIRSNLRSCELAGQRPIEHQLKRATRAQREDAKALGRF